MLTQAKAGNIQAIETLINKTLEPKGISVKASLSTECLILVAESKHAPTQSLIVDFVKKGLLKVKPKNITKVIIRGRLSNQTINLWQDSFNLIETLQSPPTPSSIEPTVDLHPNPNTSKKTTKTRPTYTRSTTQRKTQTKKVADFTIAEVLEAVVDFLQTQNGERIIIVLATFLATSFFWNVVSPNSNQGSSQVATSGQGVSLPSIPLVNPKYTIKGSLTLVDSDIEGSDEYCYGGGGYSDIEANMSVTIRDGQGNILATGNTGSGQKESLVQCVFSFEIPDIPKSDFYAIEVGRRGELNYSFEELNAKEWTVGLSIGL